ncbi:hypothetical protein BV25DRAFT_1843787, partial [Artomyces pyxidatus]
SDLLELEPYQSTGAFLEHMHDSLHLEKMKRGANLWSEGDGGEMEKWMCAECLKSDKADARGKADRNRVKLSAPNCSVPRRCTQVRSIHYARSIRSAGPSNRLSGTLSSPPSSFIPYLTLHTTPTITAVTCVVTDPVDIPVVNSGSHRMSRKTRSAKTYSPYNIRYAPDDFDLDAALRASWESFEAGDDNHYIPSSGSRVSASDRPSRSESRVSVASSLGEFQAAEGTSSSSLTPAQNALSASAVHAAPASITPTNPHSRALKPQQLYDSL